MRKFLRIYLPMLPLLIGLLGGVVIIGILAVELVASLVRLVIN